MLQKIWDGLRRLLAQELQEWRAAFEVGKETKKWGNLLKSVVFSLPMCILLLLLFLPLGVAFSAIWLYRIGQINKRYRLVALFAAVVLAILMLADLPVLEDEVFWVKGYFEDESAKSDSSYDIVLQMAHENVHEILAADSVDMEALQSEYEFLLGLRASEYFFKTYGYGFFTGDYDEKRFDDVADEMKKISEEMKDYFPDEDVDVICTNAAIAASNDFDESRIDYASMLIGSVGKPDMEAMWELYFESLLPGPVK